MIYFFGDPSFKIFAVQTPSTLNNLDKEKLSWLFGDQPCLSSASIDAFFVGPRAAMITPWSTNTTEMTQNMGISDIVRIEEFKAVPEEFKAFDPML
jgi:phosphoribosylformylglycinamidine synthase